MRYLVTIILAVSGFLGTALAQSTDSQIKTAEFFSPIGINAVPGRSCFSFSEEKFVSRTSGDVCFGFIRAGQAQDWFMATGDGTRNKVRNIGQKNWDKDFKVPVVEPYAALPFGQSRIGFPNPIARAEFPSISQTELPAQEPGEKRFNVNERMRFGDLRPGTRPNADYDPFVQAKLGKTYVVRVVDTKNDFYVLMRVDELERGRRCKISWKRIDAPTD